mmetsp:Transcript_24468/g.70511  ORF Transcript_24468/g.70511 Transcript_24468/m.70511 type:complete len:170 (+) Transcript_24468:114-623(+)
MSWTQVYLTGLPRTILPTDEQIESKLDEAYGLQQHHPSLLWAGAGTTLVKRDSRDSGGRCRGFAFLAFYSHEGAELAVERINTIGIEQYDDNDDDNGKEAITGVASPLRLRAELSQPKAKSKRGKSKSSKGGEDVSDVRLRRQRGAPIRKHPVITSSSGKRTNLGNKTK